MKAHDGDGVMVTGADTPFKCAVMAHLRSTHGVGQVVGVNTKETDRNRPATAGVRAVHADLSNRRDVRDLLFGDRAHGVSTIVHGPLQVEPGALSGAHCDFDVRATRELLAAAEEAPGIRTFIFCSASSVYRLARDEPRLIGENEPLDLGSPFPRTRSVVECDVTACTRIANSRLRIAVLRSAEVLAPGCGGQLYDYLSSHICLRPLGYDPMVNVLSLADAAQAVALAVASSAAGVFNIPGRDTLPLSELIHRTGRVGLPLPGPLLAPLYRARSALTAGRFRYALDEMRFHYGAILDGRKAESVLGYVPQHAVHLGTLFRSLKLQPESQR